MQRTSRRHGWQLEETPRSPAGLAPAIALDATTAWAASKSTGQRNAPLGRECGDTLVWAEPSVLPR